MTPGGADPLAPWLARWDLALDGAPFETRFGSRLAPVIWRGQAAMLKLAASEEEQRGGDLMAWYGGVGAARVLRRQGEAILMERLTGARSLSAMAADGRDAEATEILCATAVRLHRPRPEAPPASLVPLGAWFRALKDVEWEAGSTFAKAAATAVELLAEPRDVVVLHGDFHHDNVLDGGDRGWLVIDPKGLVGERAFEYANLFRNPTAEIALAPGRLSQRAEIVADAAGLELRRLLRWVLAYAGLGAVWSTQSDHDPRPGLAIAERAAAELQAI